MTKNQQTECFERIAFECELREHPADVNTAKAFYDWLHDHGYSVMGAKRFVTRVIREGIEQRQVDDVKHYLATDPHYAQVLGDVLRNQCLIQCRNGYELVIERGGNSPVWVTGSKPKVRTAEDQPPLARMPAEDIEEIRFEPVKHTVRIGALWVMHAVGAEMQRRAAGRRRAARRRA